MGYAEELQIMLLAIANEDTDFMWNAMDPDTGETTPFQVCSTFEEVKRQVKKYMSDRAHRNHMILVQLDSNDAAEEWALGYCTRDGWYIEY